MVACMSVLWTEAANTSNAAQLLLVLNARDDGTTTLAHVALGCGLAEMTETTGSIPYLINKGCLLQSKHKVHFHEACPDGRCRACVLHEHILRSH